MFAVIRAGGHQYKVSQGETLTIDRHQGEVGDKIKFEQVLMIGGDKIMFGAPTLAGAAVEATIKSQTRDDKILVFKYKRRKNYKRTYGHRQPRTVIEIGKIIAP